MPSRMMFVRVYPRAFFQGRMRARHLRHKNWRRSFGRQIRPRRHAGDPLALRPVLACKPGALRNGAPFYSDWLLPAGMERVRRKLAGAHAGNRSIKALLDATERVSKVRPTFAI